jgi:nitronate monooxygenase
MWNDQRLLHLLDIEHPILQAPMAGSTTPELVAAVSDAGALGGFGAAGSSPAGLRSTIREIRALTEGLFNINLRSMIEKRGQDSVSANNSPPTTRS